MFLVFDIVKTSKHEYIVVAVDDSDAREQPVYGLTRATKANIKLVEQGQMPASRYYYNQSVLRYVRSI
jgi:hypothetical protein